MVSPSPAYGSGTVPARSRRRWPRRLLIILVVLALVLIGADRGGVLVAERIAGDTIKTSQQLGTRPEVDIAGFPFLTQLAAGHYDDVTITAHDVVLGQGQLERPLRVDSVIVHLHDVTVPRDFSSVSAASGTADAHARYAAVSTTLGAPISYDGPSDGGRVKTSTTIAVAGTGVTGRASAAVRASSADGLRFVDLKVSVANQRVPGIDRALAAIFAIAIPLDALPFGIAVDGLDVQPGGLVLHLSGRNLTYR